MSFSGGAGHKSPFAERAKATTKSHLSPRRSCTAISGVGNSRSVQQSLFGKEATFGAGKIDSQSENSQSAKAVGQLRNAQPDVKEPTTPTRASEGAPPKVNSNRRDEFASLNGRKLGTPIKTPIRHPFGTTPPRSPKRPYMGSPKYQKVLLERPAFYNSPAAVEPATESGKKEVSISELQKRLKRFLQDENVEVNQLEMTRCEHLDEVPANISRSPRVNPLFHHDNDTVLQVARGGVAFTAGMMTDTTSIMHARPDAVRTHMRPVALFTEEADVMSVPLPTVTDTSSSMRARPGGVAFTAGGEDDACAPAQPVCLVKEDAQMSASLLKTLPTSPNPPCDSKDVTQPASSLACEPAEILRCEDFPVHSEIGNGSQAEEEGSQIEERCAEDGIQTPPSPELHPNSSIVEVDELQGATTSLNNSSDETNLEAHANGTKVDEISEEEDEEEILDSWSQRILSFVVLAVVVACVMGVMVLASGSQGLLPPGLHSSPFGCSRWSSPVVPVSVGFLGMGREHEGMECLPAVHLGLQCMGASCHEGSPSSHPSESLHSSRKDPELAEIDINNVVVDTDHELKTVTDYYKELQERLFSDVASLTGDTALSDASEAETAMEDVSGIGVVDDVAEVVGTEDVVEGAAALEDVSEVACDVLEALAAADDVAEPADELAEELQLGTLLPPEGHGREEPETSIAPNLEELQTVILDTTTELETHQLPTDVKLDASDAVNHVPDLVPTASIAPSEPVTSVLGVSSVLGSQQEEIAPLVAMEELAVNDIPADIILLLNVPPVTTVEVLFTDETPATFPVQGTDEEGSSPTVEDIVDIHEEEQHIHVSNEEPQTQSSAKEALAGSNVAPTAESEDTPVEGRYPVATVGLLVAALAVAITLLLKSQKRGHTVTTLASAIEAETAAERTAFKSMGYNSPSVARSVFDSHIPGKDELDAITSPLKSTRPKRNYPKYAPVVEPALSAPGLFQPRARVVVEPPRPATTWHPAMRAACSRATLSTTSGYRQTASYVPTAPSESGVSTSTRGASDATDSVCESALTMGTEEWEHLGSFTTTELVSVNEGGEEHRIRTPVRRSQRIRNRLSPLTVKFT